MSESFCWQQHKNGSKAMEHPREETEEGQVKLSALFILCCLSCHAHAYRVEATAPFGLSGKITSYGTAAGVDKHELITCWHVVEDATEVHIKVGDEWAACEVVRKDEANDLVILRTKVKVRHTKLADRAPPKGAVLDMTASDRGQPLTAHVGKVMQEGYANFDSVQEGNSGAPVLHNGKIVGILTSIVLGTTTGRYVAADTVRNLMDEEREDTE